MKRRSNPEGRPPVYGRKSSIRVQMTRYDEICQHPCPEPNTNLKLSNPSPDYQYQTL